MGLGYKLAPEPLLILVVRTGLIGLRVRTTEVTSFEAATPPQSGGSIFTIQIWARRQAAAMRWWRQPASRPQAWRSSRSASAGN
jgi:hypothetical protein